jgi:GNAT superfamily N-acetyltransferase
MLSVLQADLSWEQSTVCELFSEYLHWLCPRIRLEYDANPDADSILARDMEQLHVYLPPIGILLLAHVEQGVAGCACARTLQPGTAELKRVWVRPAFRRQGIGRALVQGTIHQLKAQGFSILRLDSAGFMTDAHAFYRSMAFLDTAPYEGSDVPPQAQKHSVFMQLQLVQDACDAAR